MLRRITVLLSLIAVAFAGVVPSDAATKKTPPPINKSYDLKLNPDPTSEALGGDAEGCGGLLKASQDKHPFTVPAGGKRTVHLVSPDQTGKGLVFDWDFYLLAPDGSFIDQSNGLGADEQTITTFKKKTSFVIWACNLTGQPNAHVTINFKYA